MKSSDRAYWVAWSQIHGVGPVLLMRLYRHFSSVEAAWCATPADLLAVEGIGLQTASAIAHARSTIQPDQLLIRHEQENPNFWTPADEHYPQLLLEIPDPPPVLYYRGQILPGENRGIIPMISIVGTRKPSEYGRRWTRRIARTLAQAGFSVVSGLAMGVDAIAHHSCLECNGRTIAVVGTGVNIAYPWTNRQLAAAIAERGLIVSEYPMGTKPAAAHFPRRNRIIAGLCRATLVLEAPVKSGALITARVANEYGRDVYALPGSLDEHRAEGCLRLMSQGAHTILSETYLLEMLGAIPKLKEPSAERFNQRHQSQQRSSTRMAHQPHLAKNDTQTDSPAASGLRSPGVMLPGLKTNAGDDFGLIEHMALSSAPSQTAATVIPPPMELDANTQSVWNAIPLNTAISLDAIVQSCQLPTGDVLASLSQLELLGLVRQSAGMMYQRD